jgi:Ca2+-binding RTX toxin-like protein
VLHGGGGRDTFIFRSGTDTITDFIAPVDRLQLDDALWQGTLNAPQIITQFARVTGNNTVFDFGGDHILTLEDWSDLAALSDRIDII